MHITTKKGQEQMNSNYVKKACGFGKKKNPTKPTPKTQTTTKPQHKQKNNLDVYSWVLKYLHFSGVFLTSPNETTRQFWEECSAIKSEVWGKNARIKRRKYLSSLVHRISLQGKRNQTPASEYGLQKRWVFSLGLTSDWMKLQVVSQSVPC